MVVNCVIRRILTVQKHLWLNSVSLVPVTLTISALAHMALHGLVQHVQWVVRVSVASAALAIFTWEHIVLACHGLLHAIQIQR